MLGSFRRKIGAWVGGFEGAQASRRLRGFQASRSHVNALIQSAGPDLNARARYMVRNNGYAAAAVESWASNCVGTGVKPSSLIPASGRKSKLQNLWLKWTDQADAEGLTDFYGLQRRISREFFITGECFVRVRYRRPEDGLSVPMQLQVLPSEMLPMNKNETMPNGNHIRQGIEFNGIGARVAYHFYKRHPNDSTEAGIYNETSRILASDVVHIIDPVESGQLRGVSKFSPALAKLFLLDQYDDAELDRKKIAAMFAIFITSPIDGSGKSEIDGDIAGELQPGSIMRLDQGEQVQVSQPADSGSTYEPFQYRTLLQVASGLGIPYPHLTQDMVKANFSSARTSLMEFRRRVEAFQHSVLVFQLCRPVWERFMDMAVSSGALSFPNYTKRRTEYQSCEWLPPRWMWVDPLKDVKAEIMEIDAGLKSRSQAVSERGYDVDTLDKQISDDKRREKSLGLVFGQDQTPVNAQEPEEIDEIPPLPEQEQQ